MSMLAYDAYRDSGAAWLGDVPDHWEVLPARHAFVERDERSVTGDETLLTVSHITGVTPRSEKSVTMTEAESTEGYKLCFPGDLVINTLWAWMGAVGVAKVEGIVSPAYNIYCPRANYAAAYVEALFRMPAFAREAERYSKGVWSSRLRLYPTEFFQILLPVPPFDEQAAIATFLEGETAKMAAPVAAQRRLVALLKERIASQVLSNSGSEGAKEMRLEHACTVVQRPVQQVLGEIYEPLGLFNRGRGLFHKDPRSMAEMGDSDFFWVQAGDLIISGQFAWEGAVALAGDAEAGCVVSHRYPILRGNPGVALTEYLFAYLLTDHGNFLMSECSRGSAGRNRPLNISLLMKETIPIPEMRIQESVAAAVHALARLQAEIVQQEALLQERRNALISAAVTGKIDVRQQAGRSVPADQLTARRLVGAAVLELVADNSSSGRMTSAKRLYLAEAHAGVWELRGKPERMAAGPFDRDLMREVEAELARVGHIATSQPGGPNSQVLYNLTGTRGALRAQLDALLGDRRAVFDGTLADLATLESRGVEAVATLFAVWNDMLIEGQTPTDDAVIDGVLNDWHAEKRDKFTRPDLVNYLGWMRRHELTPSGRGPRTKSGALL